VTLGTFNATSAINGIVRIKLLCLIVNFTAQPNNVFRKNCHGRGEELNTLINGLINN
jgi:hypothetical protein